MRSLVWALIHQDWCAYKKRKFRNRQVWREDDVKTQREKMVLQLEWHLQAKEGQGLMANTSR